MKCRKTKRRVVLYVGKLLLCIFYLGISNEDFEASIKVLFIMILKFARSSNFFNDQSDSNALKHFFDSNLCPSGNCEIEDSRVLEKQLNILFSLGNEVQKNHFVP